jgi:hypothetical protein
MNRRKTEAILYHFSNPALAFIGAAAPKNPRRRDPNGNPAF